MNVKELKELLKDFDDNKEVYVVSSDNSEIFEKCKFVENSIVVGEDFCVPDISNYDWVRDDINADFVVALIY